MSMCAKNGKKRSCITKWLESAFTTGQKGSSAFSIFVFVGLVVIVLLAVMLKQLSSVFE